MNVDNSKSIQGHNCGDQTNNAYRKLEESLKANGYEAYNITSTIDLLSRLATAKVNNIPRLELKLRNMSLNKQRFLDILTEGWALDLFTANGFDTDYEPNGRAGPDLLVKRDGQYIYVEVTRLQENPRERDEVEQARKEDRIIFGPRPAQSISRVIDVMIRKARQSIKGKPYMILIKSMRFWDDDTIAGWAWNDFSAHKEKEKISGILFDSGYKKRDTGQRFYFYANSFSIDPVDVELAELLANLTPPTFDPVLLKYGYLSPL